MLIIGIDPGLKGGLAAIDTEDMRPQVWPMPTLGGEIDIDEVLDLLYGANLVVVEKCQAFPKMGVVPAFKLGQCYGTLLALSGIHAASTRIVRPQEWKKTILKGYKKGKEASVLYCKHRFPDLKLKKTDDGIADAICIALYGIKESG